MSVVVCSFIDNIAQNMILRQCMQVEFYASHINTRITSVNVGEFQIL